MPRLKKPELRTDKEEQQWLFDVALEHIRKQGGPSADPSGECIYRGPNGTGCAARPFIRRYKEGMEGIEWSGLVRVYEDSLEPLAIKHKDLIDEIQSNHDYPARDQELDGEDFLDSFENNMNLTAYNHKLHYEPLVTTKETPND